MKTLTVSLKTSEQVFSDFENALKQAGKDKLKRGFHISFDSKKDFSRFVRNIDVLMCIINRHPQSVYELSKFVNKDISNVNKLILFFHSIGAVEIKHKKVAGREVHTPVVSFDTILFNLAA